MIFDGFLHTYIAKHDIITLLLHYKTSYDISPTEKCICGESILDFHNELREQKAIHVPERL